MKHKPPRKTKVTTGIAIKIDEAARTSSRFENKTSKFNLITFNSCLFLRKAIKQPQTVVLDCNIPGPLA